MTDRQDNGRNFREWQTVRVLYENKLKFNNREVGVSLVARKAVFQNGNVGRLKLALIISRDNRYVYFPLYDEMWEEIRFIHTCMGSLLDLIEPYREEYMEIVKQDRAEYHTRRAEELKNM